MAQDEEMMDLISGVLYYLAEAAGGEIVIGELNLRTNAKVYIDKDDGLVRVIALPDSVALGIDLAEEELIAIRKAKEKARLVKKDEGVTFTYKASVSPAQWSSNFTFDEITGDHAITVHPNGSIMDPLSDKSTEE